LPSATRERGISHSHHHRSPSHRRLGRGVCRRAGHRSLGLPARPTQPGDRCLPGHPRHCGVRGDRRFGPAQAAAGPVPPGRGWADARQIRIIGSSRQGLTGEQSWTAEPPVSVIGDRLQSQRRTEPGVL